MSTPTAFQPPTSCLASTYTLEPAGSDTMRAYPGIILSRGADTACFPPGYLSTSYFTITPLGKQSLPSASSTSCIYTTRGSDFALSPAQCPSGYVTVGTAIATPGQTYQFGRTTRTATVTSATCCPSKFTWDGVADCLATGRTGITYIDRTETTTAFGLQEYATPVIVAFEAVKAVQTSSSNSAGNIVNSTAISSPTSASDTQNQPSGTSLSTGAKAGIGAAAAISVVAIAAALILLLRRRAKRRQAVKDTDTANSYTKAELPAESKHNTELDSQAALHEAGGLHKTAEADNSSRAELESDWTGWEAPALLEIDLSRVQPPSTASTETHENDVGDRQMPRN